ncbi:MAG: YjbQ family protein [Rhodospirillales bacterium]|nr:YjbQ family protein [Rhodospirillales bacterium]MBO6788421.1 YjbQ family protein [Rhodospirillales bacterium]
MAHAQTQLQISTHGQGLYEFTRDAVGFCAESGMAAGLLTLYCRHTSASLTIQENADPDVIHDLNVFFKRLVSEDPSLYRHTAEGPDDMPAHIRSALSDVSLSIPVADGRPVLGTWQGIYLFEHRTRPHRRNVVLHLNGD